MENYNSLDGNRPFDAGMYEVAQYLEDNKEALNGLVVGSVENTVFDENGDIVECYDPNPDQVFMNMAGLQNVEVWKTLYS